MGRTRFLENNRPFGPERGSIKGQAVGFVSHSLPKVRTISLGSRPDRINKWQYTCSNGLPPPHVFDTYNFQHGQRDPLIEIPAHLRFQRKLGQILATSATEIAHVALSIEHEGSRTGALTSMINIFSLQLTQLESECPNKLSEYSLLRVNHMIYAHFLGTTAHLLGQRTTTNLYQRPAFKESRRPFPDTSFWHTEALPSAIL